MPSDTPTKRAVGTRLRCALSAVLVALVAASLVASPAQGQALPQSLAGEQFAPGQVSVNPACGSTFTITYTASGPATGPYTGTYSETGTITGTFAGGEEQFQTWNASFTIDSPQGHVTGEKTLRAGVLLRCRETTIPITFTDADAELAYSATITTGSGTFTDQGQATASVSERIFPGCSNPFEGCDPPEPPVELDGFSESFTSSTGVLPTSGKATGGGQVISGDNRVTFGFNASKTPDGLRLRGNCKVLDHATRAKVKCLTVTDYVQIGNTATWEGTASVNGVQQPYRITVQDNGEPNRGVDTFSITAATYQAAGKVRRGNVQVKNQRKQCLPSRRKNQRKRCLSSRRQPVSLALRESTQTPLAHTHFGERGVHHGGHQRGAGTRGRDCQPGTTAGADQSRSLPRTC
jgi:hypothetical protein